jgi:tetratricopeptide (TPR) repeat protein
MFLQNSMYYPRSQSEHINCVYNLAEERWARYQLSQDKKDLDQSIVHRTKAIFLPPISRDGPHLNGVFGLLFQLACALLGRSRDFDQPEDINYSIKYLRYLRELPLDSLNFPGHLVTISLIHALATQVTLDAGDGTQNINEMVVLCRELLTSKSTDIPVGAFKSLDQAVDAKFNLGLPIQLLDEVIECLRDAVEVCPLGSHDVLYALANQLLIRFFGTHSNVDYEEATALLERILEPNQPKECPESIRVRALTLAAVLAYTRSAVFKNPEYSEVTISRLRTELSSPSINERRRLQVTESLEIQSRLRFTQYSLAENLEEANSYTSQVVGLLSSPSLVKSGQLFAATKAARETYSVTAIQQIIQNHEELLSITPPGTERHIECLSILADWYESKFDRTDEISDIEESIKYSRLSLDATHSSHPRRYISLASLRNVLCLMFNKTGKISYLDESITLSYYILELKNV